MGAEFPIADENILTAALRHGVAVQYGCRHGKCSSCKHWLVEGEVEDSRASVYALSRDERENGAILLCCTHAKTDLVIEVDGENEAEDLPRLEPPSSQVATIVQQRALTPKLIELCLEIDHPLNFRAGQYAELTLADSGQRRSFSIVNPPSSGTELMFCIKHVPDGMFSGRLGELVPGTKLDVEGPFGTMFLRETGRPVIAAAIGSGIAPILSLLADAAERSIDVPILFYYGAASAEDLVYLERLFELSQQLRDLHFIPCLSHGDPERVPNARAGRVTRVISADIRDASDYDAYLCGAPDMCDTVGQLLELKGLTANRIHADKFYPAL